MEDVCNQFVACYSYFGKRYTVYWKECKAFFYQT